MCYTKLLNRVKYSKLLGNLICPMVNTWHQESGPISNVSEEKMILVTILAASDFDVLKNLGNDRLATIGNAGLPRRGGVPLSFSIS